MFKVTKFQELASQDYHLGLINIFMNTENSTLITTH